MIPKNSGHLVVGLIMMVVLVVLCIIQNDITYAWIASAFGVNLMITDALIDNVRNIKSKRTGGKK